MGQYDKLAQVRKPILRTPDVPIQPRLTRLKPTDASPLNPTKLARISVSGGMRCQEKSAGIVVTMASVFGAAACPQGAISPV